MRIVITYVCFFKFVCGTGRGVKKQPVPARDSEKVLFFSRPNDIKDTIPPGFLAFKMVRRFFFKTVRLGARVPRAAAGAANSKK
jgi:hypothetical protein